MTHWSERTSCIGCGRTFKVGGAAEARHRHNFPALCKNPVRAQQLANQRAAEAQRGQHCDQRLMVDP